MEMPLQEMHSVQTYMVNGSGSENHGLNLIFSSGTTTLPNFPTPDQLPDQQSCIISVPSPANSPTAQLPEQSCIISVAGAPAIPDTSSISPACHYLTREEAFRSIRNSIPHLWMYTQLLRSESSYQKEASSHKKAVRRQSKHIYIIVSMYAVLQGAIFTAVAQSSIFTCADRWGPVSLVCAFTLGTVFAVLDKLRHMGKQRQEVKKAERRQWAVHDKIMLLYWRGSLCEIEALEPSHSVLFKDDAGRMCIFSARGMLVLGFLLGFSSLMIVSCIIMLKCPPCRCHR